MSIEAVKWAMDDAPMLRTPAGKFDTTARHVLQAMAEHADAKGKNCHPSEIRLQYRTGYDRRTVQRARRRLEDAKLIIRDGMVQDRIKYKLSMHLLRDASDWEELEREEAASKEAAAERKRRSRAKHVTHSNDVTVTDAGAVTEPGVTHSESGRHALEMRDVTHFKSGRHALSAAVTTNQPPEEPPATNWAGVGSSTCGPQGLAPSAPIDDAGFVVTDVMRRWAAGVYPGLDIEHSTDQFISHYRSTGAQRHSWPDAWQKWIREDAKSASRRQQPRAGSNVIHLPNGQTLSGTDAKVAAHSALTEQLRALENRESS
ncbi:helix-turn-helix domain-containing protein [Streptomyces sp. NPDC127069]|uniref:helix-turn-helix domain-containing protein n=1 Tax=Streptomyces sp. NPDC127069 TaxID=3347128 RepID=UPI0036523F56